MSSAEGINLLPPKPVHLLSYTEDLSTAPQTLYRAPSYPAIIIQVYCIMVTNYNTRRGHYNETTITNNEEVLDLLLMQQNKVTNIREWKQTETI